MFCSGGGGGYCPRTKVIRTIVTHNFIQIISTKNILHGGILEWGGLCVGGILS